jgi:hypothetical protein
MTVRRILLIVFLLGIWGQAAASVCPEAHVAVAPAQKALEIAVPAVAEEFATIGGEHRCGCPARIQDAHAAVSESGKSLFVSYVEGADAFPNSSNPDSIALAVHASASSFIARHSGQPPYLLASRLRQ